MDTVANHVWQINTKYKVAIDETLCLWNIWPSYCADNITIWLWTNITEEHVPTRCHSYTCTHVFKHV